MSKDYYGSQRQPTECQYCHLIFTGRDCLYKHGKRSGKCIRLRTAINTATAASVCPWSEYGSPQVEIILAQIAALPIEEETAVEVLPA